MSDNTLNIYQRAQILARELQRLRASTGIVVVEPRATAVAEGVLAEDPLDEGFTLGANEGLCWRDAGLVADILEEEMDRINDGDRQLRLPNIVDRLERIIALLRRQAETDTTHAENPYLANLLVKDSNQDSACGHFLGIPIPSDASLQLSIHPETVEQFNATIRQALEAGLPAVAKQGDTTEWAELGTQKRQVILFVPRNGSAREQIRLVVDEKIDATGFVDVHPADLLSTDASDEEVRAAVKRLDSEINDEQAFDATRRELRADPVPQTAHEMMDRVGDVMGNDPEQADSGSVMEASEKLVDAADGLDEATSRPIHTHAGHVACYPTCPAFDRVVADRLDSAEGEGLGNGYA